MNVEIVSCSPFIVELTIWNHMKHGHPRARFNMKTAALSLRYAADFGGLTYTHEHPQAGAAVPLSEGDCADIKRLVLKRLSLTGFHNPQDTKDLNRWFSGCPKYPAYYFIMWNRAGGGLEHTIINERHLADMRDGLKG